MLYYKQQVAWCWCLLKLPHNHNEVISHTLGCCGLAEQVTMDGRCIQPFLPTLRGASKELKRIAWHNQTCFLVFRLALYIHVSMCAHMNVSMCISQSSEEQQNWIESLLFSLHMCVYIYVIQINPIYVHDLRAVVRLTQQWLTMIRKS